MFKHKFFKGIFGIFFLYFFIFLIIFLAYLLILNINILVLNIVFMVLLFIGIHYDSRFNWKSQLLLLIIILIQLVLWYYLEIVPMLIIKDLFWFSVVLNISFIWHVLILHWCFELCEHNRYDLGCYICSRLSVVTSLTGMFWLLNFISFFVNWVCNYFYWTLNMREKPSKLSKFESLLSKLQGLEYPINLIISVFKAIILYFMTIFKNYCLLLLGKHKNPFWKQPLWYYLRFLILFITSIYLMIPRIYIIWAILLMLKIIDVLYNTIKARISNKNWKFIIWFITMEYEIIGNYLTEPGFDVCWDLIYNKEYYLDYVIFCNNLDWFFSDYILERSPYNLYDIFEVFIYNPDRRIRIIVNYCSFDDVIDTSYIKLYNLGITEEEFSEKLEEKRKLPYIKNYYSIIRRVSLWDYIKLEEGHYL